MVVIDFTIAAFVERRNQSWKTRRDQTKARENAVADERTMLEMEETKEFTRHNKWLDVEGRKGNG